VKIETHSCSLGQDFVSVANFRFELGVESSAAEMERVLVMLRRSNPGIVVLSRSLSLALDLTSSFLLSLKRVVHGTTLKFLKYRKFAAKRGQKETNLATSVWGRARTCSMIHNNGPFTLFRPAVQRA
jgi:hypothetical protein